MNTLKDLPIDTHYENMRSRNELEDAYKVMNAFFDFFDEKNAQGTLWFMVEATMTQDSERVDAIERGNVLYFYQYCFRLIDAARKVSNDYKRKHQRPKERKQKMSEKSTFLKKQNRAKSERVAKQG